VGKDPASENNKDRKNKSVIKITLAETAEEILSEVLR